MAVTRTSAGTMASGLGAITPTFGAGAAAGDFGILIVETAKQGVTAPSGWTEISSGITVGFGTAGAAGASKLQIFKRDSITSGEVSGGVSVADGGDHQNAALLSYSGVDTSVTYTLGDGISGSTEQSTATTSVSSSSLAATNGKNGGIVLAIIATDRDNNTASTNTSASWGGITGSNSFIVNGSSSTGAGGGIIVNELVANADATAGMTFSCSITSSAYSIVLVAMKPPNSTHAATGAITGPGSTVAGSAAHIAIHGTSGAITGAGATVAGSAAHIAIHPTSGTLAGQLGSVAGSAARTRQHATTGALTGPGTTLAGVAVYNAKHTTSGTLTGQLGAVSGSATRFRAFATSGVLTGQGSVIVGAAAHIAVHGTSGSLTGQLGSLSGSAARFRAFDASGSLAGSGAALSGSADRVDGAVATTHAASGSLIGQIGTVSASATRFREFSASGDLVAQGAVIDLSGLHVEFVNHLLGRRRRRGAFDDYGIWGAKPMPRGGRWHSRDGTDPSQTPSPTSSGALVGTRGTVSGIATRFRAMASTAALVGQGSRIVGAASRNVAHASSGALSGQLGSVSAAATRNAAAHGATGALVGQIGSLAGSADHSASITYDTSIGNGVDSNGFADLPLKSGGTDGSDLATAAPTLGGSTTYNGTTRTFSAAFTGVAPARWNGVLTPGQTYRLYCYYRVDSSSDLVIRDESGTIQCTIDANVGGNSVIEGVFDSTFVATGTDLVFSWVSGGFGGKVRMGKLCTNSGGVPAHRYFVKPSTGSDAVDGFDAQVSSTPLASITQALKYVTAGRGDQIMVAAGETVSALPNLVGKSGYSATYPTVVQSYDSADASNTAKYGRATNRVTVSNPNSSTQSGPGTLNYLAIRGFDFNPGNTGNNAFEFTGNGTNPFNHILLENVRCLYTGISFDMSPSPSLGQKLIVRNSALTGCFFTTGPQTGQNIYVNNSNVTLEDNVNWHGGWKVGAGRDDDYTAGGLGGGAAVFRHPTYITANAELVATLPTAIVRRNLIADGAADSGTHRTSITFNHNLIFDCPIAISLGGGDSYDHKFPNGIDITATQNAVIGAPDINSSNLRGWGMVTANAKTGSSATYNLLVRGGKGGGTDANTLANVGDYIGHPSTVTFDHNVGYDFSLSGHALYGTAGFEPSEAHTTFTNNASDDPPSGSNTTSNAGSFPNAYASSNALAVAAGYASKQAFIDACIADPSAHLQRTLLATLRTGYGMTTTIS